ncbi:MAG: hypothetical protein ACFE91_13365 [Promethearchaeota archaeon]
MKRKESIEKVIRKIESIFKKQDTNQITIQRKTISEIFDADLLGIFKIFFREKNLNKIKLNYL